MGLGIDRRWATLAVAVALGAGGGSLIGFLTAPATRGDARELAPVQEVAPSTTRRPRGGFAGASSTSTIRPRPRTLPAATEGLSPATTSTSSTVRPTTTTVATTTSTTVAASTTTTSTPAGDTTTTSSTSTVSSTTSTT